MIPEKPKVEYSFRAKFVKIVDGDTVDMLIDQKMDTYREGRVRLLVVDTPEMRKPTYLAGVAAKNFSYNWFISGEIAAREVSEEWPFTILTEKDPDNFGRFLAHVWDINGNCLGVDLLNAGHADFFFKKKHTQTPPHAEKGNWIEKDMYD